MKWLKGYEAYSAALAIKSMLNGTYMLGHLRCLRRVQIRRAVFPRLKSTWTFFLQCAGTTCFQKSRVPCFKQAVPCARSEHV